MFIKWLISENCVEWREQPLTERTRRVSLLCYRYFSCCRLSVCSWVRCGVDEDDDDEDTPCFSFKSFSSIFGVSTTNGAWGFGLAPANHHHHHVIISWAASESAQSIDLVLILSKSLHDDRLISMFYVIQYRCVPFATVPAQCALLPAPWSPRRAL